MNEISLDILDQICSYLPLEFFSTFFLTCKYWSETSSSELLWKEVFTTRFSKDLIINSSLSIEKSLHLIPSTFKDSVQRNTLRKKIPIWNSRFSFIMNQNNFSPYIKELYDITFKISGSLWFERTIYTSNVYKIFFQSFQHSFQTEEVKDYALKFIDIMYHNNSIQFKEFENTFEHIFNLKNQELFQHIKPMVSSPL
jgi:hypothetical protein